VIGLAFRYDTEQGDADLMLASSWSGVHGRFLHRLGRSAIGNFASLMSYRGQFGPVEIAARTVESRDAEWTIELLHAPSTSKWK
jgi:hypothetical protein